MWLRAGERGGVASIVMGLDQNRAQIAVEWIETVTEKVDERRVCQTRVTARTACLLGTSICLALQDGVQGRCLRVAVVVGVNQDAGEEGGELLVSVQREHI